MAVQADQRRGARFAAEQVVTQGASGAESDIQ